MRRRRPRAGRRLLSPQPPADRPAVPVCPSPGSPCRAGLRAVPRVPPSGRLCLAEPARQRLCRAGLAALAAGLGLGVLAGCGTSGAASTPGAAQTCGTTRTGANVPVIVTIDRGSVSCATALRVENSYAAVVRTGQVRGTGGGAPVTVSGWTCQGFPTPEVLKTGQTSVCRDGGAEVLAVLPLQRRPLLARTDQA